MRILDLFCGAGGSAWGLHLGFPLAIIVGVDKFEQPHYPFEFHQANAIDFDLSGYDFIWCSPPCQAYSPLKSLARKDHLALIDVMRSRLEKQTTPYCIESVSGDPLHYPVVLCGMMFGLGTYRHRYFETSFKVERLSHPGHKRPTQVLGKPLKPDEMMTIVGHFSGAAQARKAMGIEHFMPQSALSQAIPPAYSKYIAGFIPVKTNSN